MSAPPNTDSDLKQNHTQDQDTESSSQSHSHSIIESASSPTTTIRQSVSSGSSHPSVTQTFADILKSPPPRQNQEKQEGGQTNLDAESLAPELKRSSSQQQQEALGKGRPGSSDLQPEQVWWLELEAILFNGHF
ncbi:uncharacterized protein L201_003014 [Kwoniella dendrophila CBS 6074]|uniref:Uncharacterized protein n=1 Tax=Kwoniella dendrophila CBS 6074 TaxID=1295534 RepID=A0AAX4JU79_9TREE